MRLSRRPRPEEEPGQFWKDFIRDTGPVFRKPTIEQLEGFIRPTWAGAGRRLQVRGRAPARDLRRAVARRDRGGQRRGVPGGPDRGLPVGPDRLLQPARAPGPRPAARVLRLSRPATGRAGTSSARSTGGSTPTFTPTSTSSSGARLPAAPRPGVHPPVPVPEPVPVSGGGGLRAVAAARADVGAARLVCAQGGTGRVRGAAGRRPARLPEPRQPRVRRRGADAAAVRPARRRRLPRDRQQGPAARPDRAARRPGRARSWCRSPPCCRSWTR